MRAGTDRERPGSKSHRAGLGLDVTGRKGGGGEESLFRLVAAAPPAVTARPSHRPPFPPPVSRDVSAAANAARLLPVRLWEPSACRGQSRDPPHPCSWAWEPVEERPEQGRALSPCSCGAEAFRPLATLALEAAQKPAGTMMDR